MHKRETWAGFTLPNPFRVPVVQYQRLGTSRDLRMVKHYLVKGRVQGVGFRWFVQREAAEIGLHGWVRNTDEGHVEVVASGDPQGITELESALREGSRGSRVDAIEQHDLTDNEGAQLGPFQIEGAW